MDVIKYSQKMTDHLERDLPKPTYEAMVLLGERPENHALTALKLKRSGLEVDPLIGGFHDLNEDHAPSLRELMEDRLNVREYTLNFTPSSDDMVKDFVGDMKESTNPHSRYRYGDYEGVRRKKVKAVAARRARNKAARKTRARGR